ISRYVAKEQGGYLKNKGNVITIGLDTQTVFYQPKDFFTGQNIQVIEHDRMSRDVANFLISLFKVQMRKFNWGGNGATLKRLNALKIMLPVDKNGDPDWDYIEYEGGRVYKEKIGKVLKYVRQKQKKLEEDQRILNKLDLVESKWKPFKLEDVATILSGRDIYKRERVVGNTPYVTSGTSNNGIGYFVGNDNDTKSSEVISVNRNGAVGHAFYHEYEAVFGNDTRRLIPYKGNKYSSLFLSLMITMQKEKYGYG